MLMMLFVSIGLTIYLVCVFAVADLLVRAFIRLWRESSDDDNEQPAPLPEPEPEPKPAPAMAALSKEEWEREFDEIFQRVWRETWKSDIN
jgi:hypothetical protein